MDLKSYEEVSAIVDSNKEDWSIKPMAEESDWECFFNGHC